MEQEKINEGNALIEQFMGSIVKDFGLNGIRYQSPLYYDMDDKKYWLWHPVKNLDYHSSWDCLMEVVQKIEKDYEGEVTIYHSCCDIGIYPKGTDSSNIVASTFHPEATGKIDATFKSIIKFIHWRNSQKTKEAI